MKYPNNKGEIIEDWGNAFTSLSIYTQSRLCKTCGPFALALKIMNLPGRTGYRPVFEIYPLWKPDVAACLDEPIFIQEIYNGKGFQFTIPFEKHSTLLPEAIKCTSQQAFLLLSTEVSVPQIIKVFEMQFSQLLIKSSPVGMAKLWEAMLFTHLYVGDVNESNRILDDIVNTSAVWQPELFEWKYGSVKTWIRNLQNVIENRDTFLERIELNKQDKRIAKLRDFSLKA